MAPSVFHTPGHGTQGFALTPLTLALVCFYPHFPWCLKKTAPSGVTWCHPEVFANLKPRESLEGLEVLPLTSQDPNTMS